ncbi:MAG: hypothetical protein WAV04_00015 [Candidatus Microsaccharimonas sp.]
MITKLLLREKVADIDIKLDELRQEAEARLESFTDYNKRIRLELQKYDLETDDPVEIARMNKIIDECYEDIRGAKDSLHFVNLDLKRKSEQGGGE